MRRPGAVMPAGEFEVHPHLVKESANRRLF